MTAQRKQRTESSPAVSRCGLILLDHSLKALAVDHGASMILADCNGRSAGDGAAALQLPGQITDLLRGRSWTSISGTCLTVGGANGSYRCTLFRVEGQTPESDAAMLAVHFQRSISTDDAIHHIASSCNLTDRELEVLRGLSTGLTSKEIAIELEISPNTVKSYIRLIMVKIGVTTRSGIVGKLLQHAAGAG